jgi:nucleotide-binding universal stress UspA family protein
MLDPARSADEAATDQPVFGSILCGVNGSRGSQEAARQAALIGGPGAHVSYLAVTYDVGVGATASATLRHAHGEAAADDARKQALELGVEAEALTLHAASATDVLLRRAADHDLLVLGAGAGSRAAGIILGGTATAAVHRAPGPVLLTRRPRRDAEFLRSILVATDTKPHAEQVLRLAVALSAQHDARLAVVAPEARAPADRLALAEEAAAVAVALGVEPIVRDTHGPAPAAICSAADRVDASLIVLGSRGLGGVRAPGSVSERVAHEARCSVLVVRSPAPRAE